MFSLLKPDVRLEGVILYLGEAGKDSREEKVNKLIGLRYLKDGVGMPAEKYTAFSFYLNFSFNNYYPTNVV